MNPRTRCLREIVLPARRLGIESRKGERRLASIPDLTSVPPCLVVLPPEFASHVNNYDLVDLKLSTALLVPCLDHAKI